MTGQRNEERVDCVALKRRAQTKIYADTKGMSVADQIDYFRRRAESGALGAWWKRVSSITVAPLAIVREAPATYRTRSRGKKS